MKTRSHDTLRYDLLELVAALDRRLLGLECDGERDIAREAHSLRRTALERIAELEQARPGPVVTQTRETA